MNKNRKWNIGKYAWWDYGKSKWQMPVDVADAPSSLTLIFKGTQLLLVNKNAVLESINLLQKSTGANLFVKNGSMALVAKCGKKYRKFKILFDSSKDAEECADCLKNHIKTLKRPEHLKSRRTSINVGTAEKCKTKEAGILREKRWQKYWNGF